MGRAADVRPNDTTAPGRRLPTWALQQVVRFLGSCGHACAGVESTQMTQSRHTASATFGIGDGLALRLLADFDVADLGPIAPFSNDRIRHLFPSCPIEENPKIIIYNLSIGLEAFFNNLTKRDEEKKTLYADDYLNILDTSFCEALLAIGKIKSTTNVKFDSIAPQEAFKS